MENKVPQKQMPKMAITGLMMFFGMIALGGLLGLLGGRAIKGTAQTASANQLSEAIRDFQSGNDKTALSIMKPLADGGNAKAEYWLADLYQSGQGRERDLVKAVDLLEKSAAQGFVPAESRLGEVYLDGEKVLQDFSKSQAWLEKAAVSGDPRSQRLLGHTYELGLGVPRDRSEAYGWYENAALAGNGLAQRMRDDLLTRMTPLEMSKGQEDAKTFAAEVQSAKLKAPIKKRSSGAPNTG